MGSSHQASLPWGLGFKDPETPTVDANTTNSLDVHHDGAVGRKVVFHERAWFWQHYQRYS